MRFHLDITLTDEDYLAFNMFHTFDSSYGKKQIRKTRIFFTGAMALLLAVYVLVMKWSFFTAIYSVLLGLFTVIYMLLFRKIAKRNLKAHIKQLKKTGKLPFDPVSSFEFHEDTFVEIAPSKRTEQRYDTIERICVVKDQYIFLFNSSIGAYILPIPQVAAQLDLDAFLHFLSQKCTAAAHE